MTERFNPFYTEFEEAVRRRKEVAEKDCTEVGLAEKSEPTAGEKTINMNFFMKKNSQTNSKLTKPDIEKLLQEAYQANPMCYEKKDGTLMIGLALTEDTDSLFPIVPEEQWAIEGKTISEWIITMVSLTNPLGGIIGQMEYHEAIKRLEPFILMKKNNWALIRAMTHEELDSLFGNLPRELY